MYKFTLSLMIISTVLVSACNKEKKLMDNLVGNWKIEASEKSILKQDGSTEVYETINNAGSLIIYEDPNNPSNESRLYEFLFIGSQNDTMKAQNTLVTDERNNRLILKNVLNPTNIQGDLSWTIEKEKKNTQVWSIYGVDSTFFYPVNNQNPGGALHWQIWRITLKKQK